MIQNNTLIAKLMDCIEQIAHNIKYPYDFNSERCLANHNTYFDLCQYIFPELEQQIQVILHNKSLSLAQKLNCLMALLSEVIQIDLQSKIQGAEILEFNLKHIHHFVSILQECSRMVKQNASRKKEIRSENGSQDTKQEMIQNGGSKSARDQSKTGPSGLNYKKKDDRLCQIVENKSRQNKLVNEQFQKEDLERQRKNYYSPQNNYLMPAQAQAKKRIKPKKKSQGYRNRSQKHQRENLHQKIVNIIMNEKTRLLKAHSRDNRKNKYQQVHNAKEQYRGFLKIYAKQNKAARKREQLLAKRSQSTVKPFKKELAHSDFDKIDNFFQSFAYRFRDKKAAYIRKLSELIRKQQLDRYCYQNRIERETRIHMEKQLGHQLFAAKHQHRVKSQIVKEAAKNMQDEVNIMKKEEMRVGTEQRRELRQAKRQQLQRIQNVLSSDNDRVLMNFQNGGRLEQLILKMYKKL